MIAAVFAFLGGRGVAVAVGIVMALALLAGARQSGVNAERSRGEAASLRAQAAILRDDLDKARQAEASARAMVETLAAARKQNEDAINELEADISKRPASRRCAIDGGDVQRLRRIR